MAGSTCCCVSVRTGTKVIAVLYMIVGCCYFAISRNLENLGSDPGSPGLWKWVQENHKVLRWVGSFLAGMQLYASYSLYRGASKGNEEKCITWLVFNIIMTVMAVILLVISIFSLPKGNPNTRRYLWYFVGFGVSIFVNLHLLIVVYKIIRELREGATEEQEEDVEQSGEGDGDETTYSGDGEAKPRRISHSRLNQLCCKFLWKSCTGHDVDDAEFPDSAS